MRHARRAPAPLGGIRPHELKAKLQHVANIKVGMLRTGKSLEEALSSVRRLRKESLPRVHCQSKDRLYNKEWADAVECRSMLDALEATALAALRRQESRGAHYREDFPTSNTADALWNGFVSRSGGELAHVARPGGLFQPATKMRVTVIRGPAPVGGSRARTYEVPDLGGASASDVLQYISGHLDGSVAYYLSCRRGLCAACVVRIDGQNEKACVVLERDEVIEPTSDRLLIKDPVCHLGMPPESKFIWRPLRTGPIPPFPNSGC